MFLRWIRSLRRWFGNLKFRYKILLLMLAAGMLPLTFIIIYMQRGMIHILTEQEIDNIDKSLERSVESIDNQGQIYQNLIDYLSYSQELREVLTSRTETDYETYIKYVTVAEPLLQMPQVYHREISRITLYAENVDVPYGDILMPMEMAKEADWYGSIGDTTDVKWSYTRGNRRAITLTRNFYAGEEIMAVLAVTLDYNEVLEPFTALLQENTGGIVFDTKGKAVYAGYSFEQDYRPKEPESLDYVKERYTCMEKKASASGWTYCVYRPKEVITTSVRQLAAQNLPIVLVCLGFLLLMAYTFSKSTVSNLERLTENMNQIHLGLRKVTVTSDSKDEVGVLIRSFTRMMNEMNRLITEVYEGQIKLKNSEMKALVAQINPHFLYNSLSIINWKALEAGADDISGVTLALSTYYRTSLNKGETMTTVENELNNIRAYLKIQRIMHDDNFFVEEYADPAVLSAETPKLILQPLVENAIDHGLDLSEKEGKRIRITVRREGDYVVFVTEDNGVGMEEQKTREILSYHSKGYGVRNINERIKILYGGRGKMSVESSPGEGTRVEIRIPVSADARSRQEKGF